MQVTPSSCSMTTVKGKHVGDDHLCGVVVRCGPQEQEILLLLHAVLVAYELVLHDL